MKIFLWFKSLPKICLSQIVVIHSYYFELFKSLIIIFIFSDRFEFELKVLIWDLFVIKWTFVLQSFLSKKLLVVWYEHISTVCLHIKLRMEHVCFQTHSCLSSICININDIYVLESCECMMYLYASNFCQLRHTSTYWE